MSLSLYPSSKRMQDSRSTLFLSPAYASAVSRELGLREASQVGVLVRVARAGRPGLCLT